MNITSFPSNSSEIQHRRFSQPIVCQLFLLKIVRLAMGKLNQHHQWLMRGSQRWAIAEVLVRPMTGLEIMRDSRKRNSHIQMPDVLFILHQLEQKGLAYCLNPQQTTGKLYFWTKLGRAVISKQSGHILRAIDRKINWNLYSYIVRAKVRRRVLLELSKLQENEVKELTTTRIRKSLNTNFPIGLNPTIRALKELSDLMLVRCVGFTEKRNLKIYQLTEIGERIADNLRQPVVALAVDRSSDLRQPLGKPF